MLQIALDLHLQLEEGILGACLVSTPVRCIFWWFLQETRVTHLCQVFCCAFAFLSYLESAPCWTLSQGFSMATHSSILAWRIPGTEEPGGLPSMGSHRVGHDWRDLAAAAAADFSRCHSHLAVEVRAGQRQVKRGKENKDVLKCRWQWPHLQGLRFPEGPRWGTQMCMSAKAPGEADAAGLRAIPGKLVFWKEGQVETLLPSTVTALHFPSVSMTTATSFSSAYYHHYLWLPIILYLFLAFPWPSFLSPTCLLWTPKGQRLCQWGFCILIVHNEQHTLGTWVNLRIIEVGVWSWPCYCTLFFWQWVKYSPIHF